MQRAFPEIIADKFNLQTHVIHENRYEGLARKFNFRIQIHQIVYYPQ